MVITINGLFSLATIPNATLIGAICKAFHRVTRANLGRWDNKYQTGY